LGPEPLTELGSMAPAVQASVRCSVASAMAALVVLLAGCGDEAGPSPSPAPGPAPAPVPPPGPCECPAGLARGHCTACHSDGIKVSCTACSKPYALNANPSSDDLYCTFDCSKFQPTAKPAKPARADGLNGVDWPGVCLDESTSKFFTIGDWGGLCGWGAGNKCTDGEVSPVCRGDTQCDPGKPVPMPNRKGDKYWKVDGLAQRLVSDVMLKRQKELVASGSPARFIVNVGDNFYPGGIDVHCGMEDQGETLVQFDQIWKKMYPEELAQLEWWGVLGNHDYGGVCYIKGWDQQIYYTWHDDKWVMPGQYWKRTVQYKTFSVDFFFVDGNVFDTTPGTTPSHSLCNADSNPGPKCETTFYPPPSPDEGGTCKPTGPVSKDNCQSWFKTMWEQNYDWLMKEVPASTADWQIVVNHYPAHFALGYAPKYMDWSKFLTPMGVDFYISGHTHEQRVLYKQPISGLDMQETAIVITGGGGGVTSESAPQDDGHDDAYGFMEITISLDELKITAFSHGGLQGEKIVRNETVVTPVKRASNEELMKLGFMPVETLVA